MSAGPETAGIAEVGDDVGASASNYTHSLDDEKPHLFVYVEDDDSTSST